MQVKGLVTGAKVLLEDGSVVEVLAPSSNGQTVQVRYLEAPFDQAAVGSVAQCSDYDIVAYVGETEMDSATPPAQ
jgi:hypothetical protein